ncbi:hypothetical protein [Curtobacterium sp. VKM Ac-1376]|uniref:hypothetical protein n=1 Tax=Curtobacterium sp. VKM Ac-1376 TaxID=123312 RepID=UPI001E53DB71|nr:hypothetical protein [Curtobacterium sp. VKM Ac-1376]
MAIPFQRRCAKEFRVALDAVRLDHIVLNHLTWEPGMQVTGADGTTRDVLGDLLSGEALDRTADTVHMHPDLLRLQEAIPSYYLAVLPQS